jgi:uncharacterized protein
MYDIVIGRGEGDRKKYGKRGTIFLGKHYVKMGQTMSLSNNIYMDIARAHVISVFGKRGGGKCLTGDTIITLVDGSQVQIKDLEQSQGQVCSLTSDLKVSGAPFSHFYKREVEQIVELNLRSGKCIKLTPEHPLLTVKGWLPVSSLSLGDRIATPRKLDFFGNASLTESEVKILAYILSEGHVSNNFILFTNKDEQIMRDFKTAITSFSDKLECKEHGKYTIRVVEHKPLVVVEQGQRNEKGQFISQSQYANRKSSLRNWLDVHGIYGKLAHEREITQVLFQLPKQKLSLFLNRLFSCDGSIHKKGENYWVITYSTSSKKFIQQIHHLLLRFGVLSTIRTKKTYRRDHFELSIRGESVSTYLQEIGFFSYKEIIASDALLSCIQIRRNPNLDVIPKEIWSMYRPSSWSSLGRDLGYSTPKSARGVMEYGVSRQKLLQIAQSTQSELLTKFATSDIYWDEIQSIRYIDEPQMVYDITVPDHHNFVANDIIVHNSYTLGVVAEGLADIEPEIAQNLSIIILDTMGIYWTMKYPNKKDEDLLRDWGLTPKPLDVKIYTPVGYYAKYKEQGIPTDFPFSIRPNELNPSDWAMAFEIKLTDEVGVMLEDVIYRMRESGANYSIADIIDAIKASHAKDVVKDAAINLFRNAMNWGVFSEQGTPIAELATGGKVSILDVSCYATQQGSWVIKQMVVGLIAQKLFIQRMLSRKDEEYRDVHKSMHYFGDDDSDTKQEYPLVWLVIDEAHEFLPKDIMVASSDPLITILREGRQPGISLILATQQPGKIHTDVLTQSDTVLSHRITAKIDTDALGTLMQSYMRAGVTEILDELPRLQGVAAIFDDTNEKLFPMRVRPRFTWHGGESPSAVPKKKKYFD